ncbi:hypothetical protein cypCar_00045841 [Cyprinus carpio]|nr:hypothetical protein cypCar_00045841 [Cyprinus carpio]
MPMTMAPLNAEAMQMQAAVVTPAEKRDGGGGANGVGGAGGRDLESQEESVSEGSIDRIPLRQWIMHGAVMFGREFCYAMETALVTPVLLQIVFGVFCEKR